MSAYLVNEETIHVLVHTAIYRGGMDNPMHWATSAEANAEGTNGVRNTSYSADRYRVAMRGTEEHIGQMLLDANAASLGALYGDDDAFVYTYRRPEFTDWEPVELLGILNCFEYQACEVTDWDTSEAYRFCCALRRRIEGLLPGAHTAPWGVTRGEDAPAHVIAAREARAARAADHRR